MAYKDLIRWSALLLVVSGIFYIPGIFHPPDNAEGIRNLAWVPVHISFFLHHLLLVFGLIGLYLFISEKNGKLGLTAFVLALSSNVMFPTLDIIQITLYPVLSKIPETVTLINPKQAGLFGLFIVVSVVVGLIGNILLGTSIIKSKQFPRWIGYLFITGWILFFVGSGSSRLAFVKSIGIIIGAAGYIWCGLSMYRSSYLTEREEVY